MVWMFDIAGYHDVGTVTDVSSYGVEATKTLLADWYGHARDLAKRSIKYKALPTSLTDTQMLRYWCNVYHYALANLAMVGNVYRLGHYNIGLREATKYISRYYSRAQRDWRDMSTLPAPPFLKQHAIENGTPVCVPGLLAPTIRFWSPANLLASASGGPTLTGYANRLLVGMASGEAWWTTLLGDIEAAYRWLARGETAIIDDFVAVTDMIDMIADVVPGTFEQGLPKFADLPGMNSNPRVVNDVLYSAICRKNDKDAATDRWTVFPVGGDDTFGGRIPVHGVGPMELTNNFTLFGAPKWGWFNAAGPGTGTYAADVDSAVRLCGSDIWVRDWTTITGPVVADVFGGTADVQQYSEELLYGPIAANTPMYSRCYRVAATLATHWMQDSIANLNPWDVMGALDDSDSWQPEIYHALVQERGYTWQFWEEPEDLGNNTAEAVAQLLRIPYIRNSSS
jgi:hypothetical protein